MLRVLDADSGKIEVDGYNMKDFDLKTLRSKTGCVPQDVFLFSDTIAGNISFGLKGDADRNLIEEAAKNAVVYDNIMEFPQKFDTLIGERGVTLSGGQKQRISIARAIIKNPDLLIFDDCLSAVDTITEEKILNNLNSIMAERTSILISHRVATVKSADKIIVLDDGKIIESGTHEELLKKGELYASFYELQKMEEEVS
jgi:ATP-binding cassette subfamily B protein